MSTSAKDASFWSPETTSRDQQHHRTPHASLHGEHRTLTGHFAFLAFDDRPKTADVAAPRIPVGPMVACFGTYKVNEDARTLTNYIATSSTTTFNGITRGQKVTLSGASLSTIGTLVKTPKGDIVPIDEWKRAK